MAQGIHIHCSGRGTGRYPLAPARGLMEPFKPSEMSWVMRVKEVALSIDNGGSLLPGARLCLGHFVVGCSKTNGSKERNPNHHAVMPGINKKTCIVLRYAVVFSLVDVNISLARALCFAGYAGVLNAGLLLTVQPKQLNNRLRTVDMCPPPPPLPLPPTPIPNPPC